MEKHRSNSRSEKLVNGILDTASDDLQKIGEEATHAVIQYIKDWVINKYSKIKTSSVYEQKIKLKELETHLAISNKTVSIGMEKKEIAIMWAMRKLGYSEEKTKEVLDLAKTAYQEIE
jgi:hypothetical protein